jgi:hypothetical protein
MNRVAMRRRHALSGGLALVTILVFWVSTVVVELAGSFEAIVTVKRAIPWGLLVLVPAMASTGITGTALTRNASGRLVGRKIMRMRAVAAIGVLVLVPCVMFLALMASHQNLGTTFYMVQAIELVAGAANITLLVLNARDGMKLSGRSRRERPAGHTA